MLSIKIQVINNNIEEVIRAFYSYCAAIKQPYQNFHKPLFICDETLGLCLEFWPKSHSREWILQNIYSYYETDELNDLWNDLTDEKNINSSVWWQEYERKHVIYNQSNI